MSMNVSDLRPDSKGVTLTVKVTDAKVVVNRPKGPKGAGLRVAEALVADHTGVIVLTAKNEQVDVVTKGATLVLKNAKIELFRGTMRLAVDQFGKIETSDEDVKANVENNMSLLEFELVSLTAPQ